MSHRSRVCSVLFDVGSDAYADASSFWAGALGRELKFDPNERYTDMPGDIDYIVQNAEPGREGMHIDIETDDVEAEVARLEKLGACKRAFVKRWWVMVAPGGQAFCVVPAQSTSWPGDAIEWD
ncbi:MAG: hypothetical protein KAJ57_11330 [Woeseiaceae bacterium]|nr:hypothetical protein [Woeseiaceae bacterium]